MSRFNDLCHQKQLQEVLIHKIVLIHKMVHYFFININFHSRSRVQETRDGELTPAKAVFSKESAQTVSSTRNISKGYRREESGKATNVMEDACNFILIKP